MTRYILVDRNSAYIWSVANALNPVDAAEACDRDSHEPKYEYAPANLYDADATYDVYIPPASFPEIEDGRDYRVVALVMRRCTYAGSLRRQRQSL